MRLLILTLILLSSCSGNELEHKTILTKRHTDNIGLCSYSYKTHENSMWIEFVDSCSFYMIGDTIGK